MINLTPIDARIQKRLFEKMKVLSRENSSLTNQPAAVGGLTHAKMATRSTFLRMSSGLEYPVILMGGELIEEGENREFAKNTTRLAAGYDEIYGKRTYLKNTSEIGTRGFKADFGGENKLKRPMPGLKSADISFKGGVRALREATIQWTCWGFEDLNRLMPHFLSHGKTIILEWGWVYDKSSLQNLPSLVDKSGVKKSAYTDYIDLVHEANGDFDYMVGIVKNFEFTTRDDGAFDCTTIITSVGASIMENAQPSKDSVNTTINYKLTNSTDLPELRSQIESARTKDSESGFENLVDFDVNSSLKVLIAYIDDFLMDQAISLSKNKKPTKIEAFKSITEELGDSGARYFLKKNDFLIIDRILPDIKLGLNLATAAVGFSVLAGGTQSVISDKAREVAKDSGVIGPPSIDEADYWVRWGWFEDNILSKFLTLVPEKLNKLPITEFRSVEPIPKEIKAKDNTKRVLYESVKIKNHISLETVDPNKYILPGQFFPVNIEQDGKKFKDNAILTSLAGLVGDENNFQPFNVGGVKTRVVQAEKGKVAKDATNVRTEPTTKPTEYGEGYLRNMLINTKVIKEAFGVSDVDEFTIESVNVGEAILSLFSIINQDLNIWNFEISQDQIETYRSKIIDTQITAVKFEPDVKINSTTQKRTDTKSIFNSTTNTLQNAGVFFFPVWQKDSMVKKQNITAKVPDAMALSIMYGANYDEIKTLGNSPSEADNLESTALAGMFKSYTENNKDVNLNKISVALKQDGYNKYGQSTPDRLGFVKPLSTKDGVYDVKAWLTENGDKIDEKYNDKITSINQQIMSTKDVELNAELNKRLPSNTPPVLPDVLYLEKPEDFLEVIKLVGNLSTGDNHTDGWENLYNSKFHSTTSRMKQPFINRISFNMGNYGKSSGPAESDSTKPLLIPLDLELDIDGIGGIVPGNSIQSTYLPQRYQEETIFQIFDVNHRVGSDGWTVTLAGKMRSTLEKLVLTETLRSLTKEIADFKKAKVVKDKQAANKKLGLEWEQKRARLVDKFFKQATFITGFFGAEDEPSSDLDIANKMMSMSPGTRFTSSIYFSPNEIANLGLLGRTNPGPFQQFENHPGSNPSAFVALNDTGTLITY